MIFQLVSPIPYSVKDKDELQSFVNKYGIIPPYTFDEKSAFVFQDLLDTLCRLSPTFQSVVGDLTWYTFGLNPMIMDGIRPGIADEPIEIPNQSQITYEEFLAGLNIRFVSLMKVARKIDLFLQASGNAYLHIKRIQVGSTVRYEFKAIHYRHAAYLNSQDPGEDFVIVSKFLGDTQRMQKFPPLILRVTPQDEPLRWMRTGRGVEEAVIHYKADNEQSNLDESDYYGRPNILSILDWLYVDHQYGVLSGKIAATEIISKKIIAFMAQDPNTIPDTDNQVQELNSEGYIGRPGKDHFVENMRVLKALTTNFGGHAGAEAASSFVGIEIPFGLEAPTTIDLEVNRDTKDATWRLETATGKICSALRWAPELTSDRPAKATLGGNLLYDIFMMKNVTTIQPRQIFFEDMINMRLQEIVTRENGRQFFNYGIKLPDVITNLIESLRKGNASMTVPQNAQDRNPDSTLQIAADNAEDTDDAE